MQASVVTLVSDDEVGEGLSCAGVIHRRAELGRSGMRVFGHVLPKERRSQSSREGLSQAAKTEQRAGVPHLEA